MSSHKNTVVSHHIPENGNYKSYILGYIISLFFTLTAYFVVVGDLLKAQISIFVIAVLAIAQFWVQMILFLHLGKESKPRWKLLVFIFMLITILILVFGSIWIMNNLDYHHTSNQKQSDEYIIKDEGYTR